MVFTLSATTHPECVPYTELLLQQEMRVLRAMPCKTIGATAHRAPALSAPVANT